MSYRSGMQLTPESDRLRNIVIGYGPDEIRLRDQILKTSSLITVDRILPWTARDAATLAPTDLDVVLALEVDVVLLATGARQTWPPPAVIAHAARRRVGLEVMDVGAACRTYNVLLGEERRVALAAILPG